MEDVLTIEELYLLIEAQNRAEDKRRQFDAAIQGIDINEGKTDESFEAIKMKAEAALAGKDEEKYAFDLIGIEIDSDDD